MASHHLVDVSLVFITNLVDFSIKFFAKEFLKFLFLFSHLRLVIDLCSVTVFLYLFKI